MHHYAGTTALITGASSGIGTEFARALAARGSHVVLVARSAPALEALAAELSHKHGVNAWPLPCDLTVPGAAQALLDATRQRGLFIDLLVNNAGFATYGRFHELPIARQHDEITLNVTALVELTHAFLPGMLSRQRGGVINVASLAAFQPDPYLTVYGATKAFVLSFSEALWAETRSGGVTVTAVCPGATDTPFYEVVNAREPAVGVHSTPAQVALAGLKAFDEQRSYVIPRRVNWALGQTSRFAPRALNALIGERLLRPRTSRELPEPQEG